MMPLKIRLERLIGEKFNFVLVNYFPKEAGIGEHTDLGGGMKLNSKIACASVGYTHVLRILMASTKEVLQEIEIPSGAIYSMEGKFQEFLLHGTKPKQAPSQEEIRMFGSQGMKLNGFARFSLTFRFIVDDVEAGKRKSKKKRHFSPKGINETKEKQIKPSAPRVPEPGQAP
jgi:hypothetical protein